MDEYVGIVCGQCNTFSPISAVQCVGCHGTLRADQANKSLDEPATAAFRIPDQLSADKAKDDTCKKCAAPVPAENKFCGACGTPSQAHKHEHQAAKKSPEAQSTGQARLVLIRGEEGATGMSYSLQGKEHIAGREEEQILFPNDTWLNCRHANFFYRNGQLVVRDENSTNGVFLRIRGAHEITDGGSFLCGQQLFRIDRSHPENTTKDTENTTFYASPQATTSFCLVQILQGGTPGLASFIHGQGIVIGREESDLNFPDDMYISGNHARLDLKNDSVVLTDSDSRNGTYVRIQNEQTLSHGDYVFLGKQLLLVEISAS